MRPRRSPPSSRWRLAPALGPGDPDRPGARPDAPVQQPDAFMASTGEGNLCRCLPGLSHAPDGVRRGRGRAAYPALARKPQSDGPRLPAGHWVIKRTHGMPAFGDCLLTDEQADAVVN